MRTDRSSVVERWALSRYPICASTNTSLTLYFQVEVGLTISVGCSARVDD